jgi:hypothetical protein
MCLFAKRSTLIDIGLYDELWVEKPGYALRDDLILYYKACLKKYRVMGVPGIMIKHLDGGSNEITRSYQTTYAGVMNHIIFWHRFIYKYNICYIKKRFQ